MVFNRRQDMAIIAISRELESLGEETAQELARLNGYTIVDKEHIEKAIAAIGLDASKLERYDEKNPGFWASLSQQRDEYLHLLTQAIYEAALGNNCIIIGRGAHAILKGIPNLLSVRIGASKSIRVERVRKSQNIDSRHALQIIESSDHDRAGFHKYFFSVDWHDPSEYDMTITTDRITPAQAAAAIDAMRKVVVTEEREREAVARLSDLLLGSKIVTEIIYNRKIPVHFLEAAVEHGVVVLHGVANTHAAVDSAVAAANLVPGVKQVESAIQLVQEFTVVP